VLRAVGQKGQRPLGAQVRRFSPERLLTQALGAIAGQDLRPVLGVGEGGYVVIEPPQPQRAKAPLEVQSRNPCGRPAT
jgi:hypothetical protein